MIRRLLRAVVVAAAAALAVILAAGPGLAHVTINPSGAAQGGFTALVFRVPNERDDASTVKLAVRFPADHPIPLVSVKPLPGWTYEVSRADLPTPIEAEGSQITEAVSTITWTAGEGASIRPGEFEEFAVSVGPLPETDQLMFPVVQTYSDGEVVRWIEPPTTSGEEPELPAPVLTLFPATGPVPVPGAVVPPGPPPPAPPVATASAPAADATAPDATAADATATDTTARWLAGAALLVGLVAGLFAGLNWRRRPTPNAAAPSESVGTEPRNWQ